MATTLTAAKLVTTEGIVNQPFLSIEDGRLVSVESRVARSSDKVTHDLGDAILMPGFLDVHIHGAANHDVMEGTPEALNAVSAFLATRGVTEYLPTTVTAGMDDTLRAVEGIADAIERGPLGGNAAPIGIHLEGPFVSHAKRGVHPPEHIVNPTVDLFDRIWQAARGTLKLMTIAPELPEAIEVIRHATELGVRISMGHSNATAEETLAGIRAGAVSATHTFNAMRALDHREPGILGTVLDRDDLYAELICDGVHVTPAMVRLFWKAKGPDRGILVTDGMSATGMPDGEYMLGGFPVQVKDGVARSHGALAGSVLTMDRAVQNFQRFTGCELADAVRMASANPAAMLGLKPDAEAANFNVFRPDGSRIATIVRGVFVEVR